MTSLVMQLAFMILIGSDVAFSIELFSSTDAMSRLVQTEQHFLESVSEYLSASRSRLEILKRLESEVSSAGFRGDDATHPVAAYHLIRRFQRLWRDFEPMTNMSHYEELHLMVDGIWRVSYTTDEDCIGALLGIIRLQNIYKLDTKTVARGSLGVEGINDRFHAMDAVDCRHLAILAMRQGLYQLAYEWIEQGLARTNKSDKRKRKHLRKLRKFAEAGLKASVSKAFDTTDEIFDNEPNMAVSYWQESDDEEESEDEGFQYTVKVETYVDSRYEELCRKPQTVAAAGNTPHCQYRVLHEGVPYVRWKQEVFSNDPFIAMFYDFLTHEESAQLISQATPKMKSSRTVAEHNRDLHRRVGTSFNAPIQRMFYERLRDSALKVMALVNDLDVKALLDRPDTQWFDIRCNILTGLDCLHSSELLQVSSYGIAGHYEPHFDYFQSSYVRTSVRQRPTEHGDRIATLMVYLNNVTMGGATVFPHLGIAVTPVAGAALVWYNLNDDGTPDDRTLHAACPVLYGHKTVSTKWIREGGQYLKRPCTRKS